MGRGRDPKAYWEEPNLQGSPALFLAKSLATNPFWSFILVRNLSLYTVFNKQPPINHLQFISQQEVKLEEKEWWRGESVWPWGTHLGSRRIHVHSTNAFHLYIHSIVQQIVTVYELAVLGAVDGGRGSRPCLAPMEPVFWGCGRG